MDPEDKTLSVDIEIATNTMAIAMSEHQYQQHRARMQQHQYNAYQDTMRNEQKNKQILANFLLLK